MPRRRKHKKTGKPSHDQGQDPGEDVATSEDVCYVMKQSKTMGRYLVASRDLPEGTVIISEDALVVGPVSDSAPICLGCYSALPDINEAERCGSCRWPLCSTNCNGLNKEYGHSREECSQLKSCDINSSNLPRNKLYNAIFPLRCLLLKDHHPEKWNILKTMEAHNDMRRRRLSIWEYNQKSIVDRIRGEWNISKYTEEEIHTVCGFIEVNSFSIGGDSLNIQGLYPKAFYIAHDCVASTSHTDDNEYHLIIFTSIPLRKDEIMTLSYTNSLQGSAKRREHLMKCKFFDCSCQRCTDPTELGTYMSALKCRNCSSGKVLPLDPLAADTSWLCDNKQCQSTHMAQNVNNLVNRIENEIKSLDHGNIEALETSIRRYNNVLHKNHYHIVGMKYTLSQLYGKLTGFLINEMSEAMLEHKIQICEDILKVFDVVEPGLTRVRGITMYELHAPLMILTIKRFEMRKISKSDLSRNMRKVAFYLKECVRILKFETKTSQEGVIRKAAEEGLAQLKSWEPIVGKL